MGERSPPMYKAHKDNEKGDYYLKHNRSQKILPERYETGKQALDAAEKVNPSARFAFKD